MFQLLKKMDFGLKFFKKIQSYFCLVTNVKNIFFLRFEALTLEFLVFRKNRFFLKLLEIVFHFEAKNNFLTKWIFLKI